MTAVAEATATNCPNCRNILPVIKGYSTWCDRCGWNIVPAEYIRKPSKLNELYEKFSLWVLSGLYKEVREQPTRVATWTPSMILAMVISVFILLLLLAFVAAGVLFFITGFQFVLGFFVSALFFLLAWLMRPRFLSEPKRTLSEKEFPALHQLVKQVVAETGTRIDMISVYEGAIFLIRTVGWSQKRVLWIPLPVWTILSTDERLAALAQELSLVRNDPPLKSFLLSTALNTLNEWNRVLPRGENLIISIILLIISLPVFLLQLVMSLVTIRDAQRSWFFADVQAARIAGTPAMVRLLKKTEYRRLLSLIAQRMRAKDCDPKTVFNEIKRVFAETPEREFLRLEKLGEMQAARLDSYMPPSWMRLSLLDEKYGAKGSLQIPAELMQEIDDQFQPVEKEVGEKFMICFPRFV